MLWTNSVLDLSGMASFYEEEVRIPNMRSFTTENNNIDKAKKGTAIFDLSTLASGTYIVKVHSEESEPRSIKIVVQH